MYLTVKQVAQRLTVSTAMVYQWIDGGELLHLRLGTKGHRGTIRVDENDLAAFLDDRKTRTERPASKPIAPPRTKRITYKHLDIP